MMKGTADYFGLNHYTSTMCGDIPVTNQSAVDWNYWSDRDLYTYRNATWLAGEYTDCCLAQTRIVVRRVITK